MSSTSARTSSLAPTTGFPRARDLYQRCLELDSRFAPAWAHLGRCHRVIGKYIDAAPDSEARAEDAFRRALALSPRLSIAHKFYANLEADIGQAQGALVRLLGEADRHGNDPELFAGLVHACRYCGLYEQSIAAHAEARRLDPNVPTSFEQTLLMTGDIDRLLAVEPPRVVAGADDGIRVIGLGLAGRRDEARRKLLDMRQSSRIPIFQAWIEYLMAWLDRRPADMTYRMSALDTLKIQDDPEAIFQEGWLLCDVGELRGRARPSSARGREGLLRVPDALRPSAVRRVAERFRVPRAAGGSGSGPPAGTRRVPRGRWRAADRLVNSSQVFIRVLQSSQKTCSG